jgi:hypothetical protein
VGAAVGVGGGVLVAIGVACGVEATAGVCPEEAGELPQVATGSLNFIGLSPVLVDVG